MRACFATCKKRLCHSTFAPSALEVVVESSLATIQAAQLIASDDTLNYPKLPVTPEELHGVKRMS